MPDIDWTGLREAAVGAMEHAYAPYSNFPVGVAGLVDDGRIVTGCNVENASYGLGLCAECGMVSQLRLTGGGRLVAVACVDGNGAPLTPCGRCRQLLWEHGGPECLVDAPGRPVRMVDLLPGAFGPDDLQRVRPDAGIRQPLVVPPGAVPAGLAVHTGKGTVFVHPDVASGRQVWTAYWERSAGFGGVPGEPTGILEEGPVWAEAVEAIAWGRTRTPRVVVIDAAGEPAWAGTAERPPGIEREWGA